MVSLRNLTAWTALAMMAVPAAAAAADAFPAPRWVFTTPSHASLRTLLSAAVMYRDGVTGALLAPTRAYVAYSTRDRTSVSAVDRASGATVWTTALDMPGKATGGRLIEIDGRVIVGIEHPETSTLTLVGMDRGDGRISWQLP